MALTRPLKKPNRWRWLSDARCAAWADPEADASKLDGLIAVVAVRVMLNAWVLKSARVSVLPRPEVPKKVWCRADRAGPETVVGGGAG